METRSRQLRSHVLKLPKTLKVFKSPRREKEVLQSLRDVVEGFERKVESPIHISDLINPRKGYWQRVKPKKLSDDAIMYFSLGYAGHEYLLKQKDEGSREKDDLCWSPDGIEYKEETVDEGGKFEHIYKKPVAIIEVKITTKRTPATTEGELHSYLQQLVSYMALEGVTYGELRIWYVSPNGPPVIKVFTVHETIENLTKYARQIKREAKKLRKALTVLNHEKLDLCERSLCYRSKCDHYDECKPEGRWKEVK